jgi:Zn-dependent protease
MHLDLSPENLRLVVVGLITLILSITVHEFGHAIVADRLGDRLPRMEGRVTLNPIAHADPIGTLALPIMFMLFTGGIGFGWGRPVRVQPAAFTRRFSMRTGHMLVAAAGPAMNILFGVLISLVWAILNWSGVTLNGFLQVGLHNAIFLNFILAFFNLIPAPPLDGGTVLAGLLPDRLQRDYEEYAKYGIFVVMAFFIIRPLSIVFVWPATKLYHLWAVSVLGLW